MSVGFSRFAIAMFLLLVVAAPDVLARGNVSLGVGYDRYLGSLGNVFGGGLMVRLNLGILRETSEFGLNLKGGPMKNKQALFGGGLYYANDWSNYWFRPRTRFTLTYDSLSGVSGHFEGVSFEIWNGLAILIPDTEYKGKGLFIGARVGISYMNQYFSPFAGVDIGIDLIPGFIFPAL